MFLRPLISLLPRFSTQSLIKPAQTLSLNSALTTPIKPTTSLLSQVRWATYGQEYQPSTVKRKRKYGFLKRLKTIGGRKILKRRMLKGRWYLSH
ncbi:hypothetical protein HK098_002815 [Nowakowskiella sp. JEL0407]|nr:hypothetical protein HK098_002815 [Nowakowskiella sp. JEL0407]